VFLLRHAEQRGGHLTDQGKDQVRSIAARFAEWVVTEWRDSPGRSVRLWQTSSSSEVTDSAELFTDEVLSRVAHLDGEAPPFPFSGDSGSRTDDARKAWTTKTVPSTATGGQDPAVVLTAYSPVRSAFEALVTWLDSDWTGPDEARPDCRAAPLLVGNDPLLGWLATQLTRTPTPVARGELVCLRQRTPGSRWKLLWTIAVEDEGEEGAVRAKIKSKMTTATGLGTVIVGLTTFLLQTALGDQPSLFEWLAVAALGTSAVLYFAALFLYDSLQMPPRFWASGFPDPSERSPVSRAWSRLRYGKPGVRRPPTSSARLLQASMVQIWTWVFTPATLFAGAGVSSLALSTVPGATQDELSLPVGLVAAVIAMIAAAVAAWVAWQRPNLGSSD
jgi:hypothetical protein